MSTNVGRSLGLNEGDSFHLYLNAFVAFDQMWSQALGPIDENVTIVYPSGHIFLVLKVEKFFDDVNGKYDNSESHGIIMEWKYFWETIYENTSPITPQDRIQRLPSVNLDHYAQQIVASFGPERTEYYLDQNYDTIQQNIVNYASQFIYSVGFSQVSVSLPVLGGVYSTRFLGLFLGLILNIVIFVLLFLSVLLIYSLLMINVETRIFEMGVMRILGTGRIGIILLLLFQAFFYAIPAWAIGLAGAAGVMYGVVEGFESLTGVSIDPVLSWESILTATALGILIPILSAIFPIRTALGKNLFESLDVRHSKTKAVEISLHRSEAGSFSWLWIITGTFFAGFGFGVYYVFPLSLLSFNLALLLNLFFFLLLGMILGLVVLSLNLENILQKLLIWIFFFWESTFVRLLVTKNLVAHRIRNRKTSIVYALSLVLFENNKKRIKQQKFLTILIFIFLKGFIIFVQVAYVVTATSFEYGIQRNAGAFMAVWGGNVANGDDIQNVEELENYCSSVPSVIESFTWQSYYLTDFLSLSGCIITNIGHAYTANQFVSAVSPNYFTSSLNDYLIVDSQVENNRTLWPSELLYTVEGSKSIILGTLYSTDSSLNLNITSHAILQLTEDTYPIQTVTRRRLKPSSFLSSCPGMSMSQFTSVASQDAIVSIPSYVRLAGLKSVDQIPLWSFLIKFTDDVTDTDKDDVITQLESITRSQSNIQVWDYRTQLKPITQTNSLVNIFFSGVTAITMIIAFFSLMASMYSNIFEQTKEIAIIRAVGVSRFAVFRIYLWEAFIVVFGSSLLGIVIGAFIGWTMTLQRVLFTQLPITVTFPWTILGIVAGTSVVVSLLATCSPVWRVVRQQTVQIMRYIG